MAKQDRGAKRYHHWIRTEQELSSLRKSGQIAASALRKVLTSVHSEVSLKQLDQVAEVEIIRLGGTPAFKTVPDYFWTTCLTINDEVVHGIPRDIQLKNGDLISIDLGAIFDGWYTDCAWTVVVGNQPTKQQEKLLQTGKRALEEAIGQAVELKQIGDISHSMQDVIEKAGYNVVRSLCGHGVGKSYHEEPEIPGFGKEGTGIKLKSGMSLAIEAIYTTGSGQVYQKDDGWTIASSDGSLAGLFEMTVIVGKSKPEIITDWRAPVF